jgi:hypothetical protein
MDSGISFGKTITGGIQDISALLPLLGTEQCEDHVSSALTKGYLYAAATPMSIFGSLGMVRAGFKTLVANISIPRWNIIGAQKLANAGFKPQGANLSLIMLDPNNGANYLLETRLGTLLEELHIDDPDKIKPRSKCGQWNVWMIFSTAFFCTLSIVPYIHLIQSGSNNLHISLRWAFPTIRAIGGFLVATSIQFLLQNRILVTVKNRLLFMSLKKRLPLMSPDDRRFIELELDHMKALGLELQLLNLERSIKLRLHPGPSESQGFVPAVRHAYTNSR